MIRKFDSIVTESGSLKSEYLPAIYFDTSVLVDFWLTGGAEYPKNELEKIEEENEPPYFEVIRKILRSDKRINKVIKLRELLNNNENKINPVTSPLALLELIEWHAESTFKDIASQTTGAKFIQRKSRKNIGEYLKAALKMREKEIKIQKEKRSGPRGLTGLEYLMHMTWIDLHYTTYDALCLNKYIYLANIVNFNFTFEKIQNEPSVYAYLQLGAADILHILFAEHLHCEYFASFDEDFSRVKDIIAEEIGIKVLKSPEQIINALKDT